MAKLIKGFDYVADKTVELTAAQWRARMIEVIRGGGRRRVEEGETFFDAGPPRPGVIAEVYGYIPDLTAKEKEELTI